MQELKLAALDGIEAEWRAEHDRASGGASGSGSYYPSYASWMSYGTSLIGTVVENLQIEINSVHIRYEDDLSIPGRPFACGFYLESLAAQTCDDAWSPKFVHRDPAAPSQQIMAFKLVELQNMAAYFNFDCDMLGDLDVKELKEKMFLDLASSSSDYAFVLNPVSATAKVRRNCSERPLNSRKTPRMSCDLQLSSIPIALSERQYRCAITSARSLHQLHKNRRYWKWRPCDPVAGNAGAWWQYAISCHMERIRERNEKNTWSTVVRKARENVVYVRAFRSHLENPVAIDQALRAEKERLDQAKDYEELKALRELAVFYLKRDRGLDEAAAAAAKEAERKASMTVSLSDAEFFVSDSSPEGEAVATQPSTLQQYLPYWVTGYTAPQAALPPAPVDEPEGSMEREDPTAQSQDPNISTLEEELLEFFSDDANVVPYKDVVLVQLSFALKQGTIKLFSDTRSYPSSPAHKQGQGSLLFELEFNDTRVEFESRPRTRSYRFQLSLGGLCLRDMITPDSMFPLLVSPQNVQGAPLCPKAAAGSRSFGGMAVSAIQSILPRAMGGSPAGPAAEGPLFYLLYETRPFSTPRVDHRLHVRSQPLNVVYNPTVLQCVTDFFKIPEELNRNSLLAQSIRSAAFDKLEEAKQKTKEEFLRGLNSILEGQALDRKTWDLVCDLSAPQIIIPEHFVNKEALIMVIDFGKLHLTNGHLKNDAGGSQVKDNEEEDDDDEEFCTPASSPGSPDPSFAEEAPPPAAAAAAESMKSPKMSRVTSQAEQAEITEQLLQQKMYDRYKASMNGMQVILGKVKDNWRHAHLKGVSSLHVLDKFSITLQLDRRVVQTADPNWPSLVVAGTLPKLNVHVNEDKVFALERMTSLLIGDAEDHYTSTVSTGVQTAADPLQAGAGASEQDDFTIFSEWRPKQLDINESSKLMVVQFCVTDMSVELQSQGKSIAELQVTGVRASLTRRPYDTNIALSVHSLLLVDAMQTFGPNFELLIASHRHVMVDSISGSLRGSEPVSPLSPGSPDPLGPHSRYSTSPMDIKKALNSLQVASGRPTSPLNFSVAPPRSPDALNFQSPSSSSQHLKRTSSSLRMDAIDPEALISIDVLIVSPNCPSLKAAADDDDSEGQEQLQLVNVQFNSLDVIANQETIVELLAFFRRVSPATAESMHRRRGRRVQTRDQHCQTIESVARYQSSNFIKVRGWIRAPT